MRCPPVVCDNTVAIRRATEGPGCQADWNRTATFGSLPLSWAASALRPPHSRRYTWWASAAGSSSACRATDQWIKVHGCLFLHPRGASVCFGFLHVKRKASGCFALTYAFGRQGSSATVLLTHHQGTEVAYHAAQCMRPPRQLPCPRWDAALRAGLHPGPWLAPRLLPLLHQAASPQST